MTGLGNNMKLALLKGMEAIGKGASNMAGNAHLKLTEINLETHRREILSELPMRALDLWQQGVKLPEPLDSMLTSLSELDERLSVLRAQRYAKVEDSKKDAEAVDAEAIEAADAMTTAQEDADAMQKCADEDQDHAEQEHEAQENANLQQDENALDENETGDNA